MSDVPTANGTAAATQPAKQPPIPRPLAHPGERKEDGPPPAKREGESKFGIALRCAEVLCAIALVFITGFYTHYAAKQATAAISAARAASDNARASVLTLFEIKKGGTDTHNLAEQTKNIATKTGSQAVATNNLATAAQESALHGGEQVAAIVDADRPWMGAAVTVNGLEVGKSPVATFIAINSGKRPAMIVSFQKAMAGLPYFPEDPPYTGIRISRSIVVPGMTLTGKIDDASEITQPTFDAISKSQLRYYVYGEVLYKDSGGRHPNVVHHTRICLVYWPSKKDFRDCDNEYADAN